MTDVLVAYESMFGDAQRFFLLDVNGPLADLLGPR